ncbi:MULTISPECIES: VanZ family protein [unclassified Colwellia]|uniref:VanZ family protein n=1 Tax=unclassified Colwellia TaxID=196834 RepID=UPI0015F58941|nr:MULTISPECIES: VanZ family protein [unclassified Colwellia]MBA6234351.1 VanZ family protein [Colwellia sp. MB02u-7]MBA6237519.1 VanZ family protein [Colwellia sp. MB02u-11]MBA6256286.1 VanZ family protein [Colwellia sp. MB3u-28]MBA6260170.1 VanZ family protein [Colwellia sp. MB3u-41]MBA6300151.1 VanZ family protein [Colwellia sp. MB3u-22]
MLKNKSANINNLLYILLITGIYLFFFIDGPTDYHNRIFLLLWNNGHILFFAVLSTLFHLKFRHYLRFSPFVLSFIIAISFGVIIELIQIKVSRKFDWNDVYLSFLGALLINSCYFVKRSTNASSLILLFIAISLIIEQQKTLFSAIKMEYLINSRLPTLAAFNSENDLNNWSGKSLSLLQTNSISTNKILKATLVANQKYTTLTLNNFYKNWEGYHSFKTSLYLEGIEVITLCIKITDMIHDTGNQAYGDRFDYCTLLTPKINNIIIPINKISTAAKSRYIDITNLSEVTFFAMNLTSNKIIYIRSIELK